MMTYAFYRAATGCNRVSRFTTDRGIHQVVVEEVLLDGIPSSDAGRNGGLLAEGVDGCLYVATGDAGQPAQAQNLASLSGKIIRIWPDGRTREIWVRGLRDPQRLAFDGGGRVMITDRDAEGVERTFVVSRGANIGDDSLPHFCHMHALPSSPAVPSNQSET